MTPGFSPFDAVPVRVVTTVEDGEVFVVTDSGFQVLIIGTGPMPWGRRVRRWLVRTFRGKDHWMTGQEILDQMRGRR